MLLCHVVYYFGSTPYLLDFTSANPKHSLPSDVILRRTTFFQPILPPSGPSNAPGFSSETLALYKSLTYLRTYLVRLKMTSERRVCLGLADVKRVRRPFICLVVCCSLNMNRRSCWLERHLSGSSPTQSHIHDHTHHCHSYCSYEPQSAQLTASSLQCESKKSPPVVFWHFSQTVGNF